MEERNVSPLYDLDKYGAEYPITPVIQAVIHIPQSIYGLGPSKFACHYRAEWPNAHKNIGSEDKLSLKRNVATVKLVKNTLTELKEPLPTLPDAVKIHQIFKEAKSNKDYTVLPQVRYLTLPSTERAQEEEYEKASARYHSEQTIFDVLSQENTGQGIRKETLDAKFQLLPEELWEKVTNKGEYIIKHIYTEREPCSFHNYKEPCNDLIAQLAKVQFGKYQIPIEVYYTNGYVDNRSKAITQAQLKEGKKYVLSQNPQILQERMDQLSKNIYLGKKIIYNNFTTKEQINNITEEIKAQSKELLLAKELQKVCNERDQLINNWKKIISENTSEKNPDFNKSGSYEGNLAFAGGKVFENILFLHREIDIRQKYIKELESQYAEFKSQSKTTSISVEPKPKYDEESVKLLEELGALKIEYKQLMYNTFILLNTNYPKVSGLANDCQKSLGKINLLIQGLKNEDIKPRDLVNSIREIKINLEQVNVNFAVLHNEEKMRLEEQNQKEKRKHSEIENDPRSAIPQIRSTPPRPKIDLIEPANKFQTSLDEYIKIINDKGLKKEENLVLFRIISRFENLIKQMKDKNSSNQIEYKKFLEDGKTFSRIIESQLSELNVTRNLHM